MGKSQQHEDFTARGSTLQLKNILNHYYVPVIVSEDEKIDYINHIISVESERTFVEQLEAYLNTPENKLKEFDWWMFSKLDEHLDEVFLPYYNRTHNRIERFKPDFVFWLKRGKDYHVLFVDPKGTKHTDYEMKVDGYRLIFEKNGKERLFPAYGKNIRVHLSLFTEDRNLLAEGYRRYWFDDFGRMISQIPVAERKRRRGSVTN